MQVSIYSEADSTDWDALVAASPIGTFQHTRRFLAYHGARFEDQSLVFRDSGGRLDAVMPAAVSPTDPTHVISHAGATYGGLVFERRRLAERAQDLIASACRVLGARGFSRFTYKAVPPHLHTAVCQADLHALWRLGGRLVRRDLWSVIDLRRERRMSKGRRRKVRKAREHGIQVQEDNSIEAYSAFLSMLTDNLAERHSARPVHTLEELRALRERFPHRVSLWVARGRLGDYLAGTWTFDLDPAALHTQYLTASDDGRRVFALDLVLDSLIERAGTTGTRYFSLGSSTERGGTVLNAGLVDYKSSFGAGWVAHDFYELGLREPAAAPASGPG